MQMYRPFFLIIYTVCIIYSIYTHIYITKTTFFNSMVDQLPCSATLLFL